MKTRLGGKYSGLFHHLIIVLFHSPRHRIRRETWPRKKKRIKKTREIRGENGGRGSFERGEKQSCATASEYEGDAREKEAKARKLKSPRVLLLQHDEIEQLSVCISKSGSWQTCL